ncbi:hypothetical protein DXK94_03190 [Arthrobacter sp. RT-1]|nr:hypothetical protein DXK94_03190 [Arthrobacter sp. RT-1]
MRLGQVGAQPGASAFCTGAEALQGEQLGPVVADQRPVSADVPEVKPAERASSKPNCLELKTALTGQV